MILKKKICFQARPNYDVVSTLLYKKINSSFDADISGIFITSDSKETADVQRFLQGEHNFEIIEVTEYFRNHWEEFTFEKLVFYEKEYNCKPIWKYIYMDRFLIEEDYDYCIKITTGYFQFWESIFKNADIDYYYDEAVATLHSAIAYIVGIKYGVKYITQFCARGEYEATHHFFGNDPYIHIMNFDREYKERTYPKEVWKNATEMLERYENEDIRPKAITMHERLPRLGISYLFKLIPRYLYARFAERYNNKYFYMNHKQYRYVFQKLIFYVRYMRCKHFYRSADLKKKYVYLALHYQPEASSIVCGQKYEKQIQFIDSWAKSLPADTLLYVKEHGAFLGHRPMEFFTEIQKYPNVVLVSPWENSRQLIIHSQAVTTLTGTVGWEAMLLRKPVILGGSVFFENAPGVVRMEDVYLKYVPFIEKWNRPTREEIIQYLCATLDAMRIGSIFNSSDEFLQDGNITLLAKSLYEMLIDIDSNPQQFNYGKLSACF